MRAGDGLRQPLRRRVLGDVAGFERGGDDDFDAGGRQRPLLRLADDLAFFQPRLAHAHGVGGNRAERLRDGRSAKFHGCSARSGFLRRAATISPAMETAISEGLTAPMSRPIGA